jgi:subtilase family serine protease
MERRFTTEGWALPARFAAMSVNWRHLGSILLSVIGSTLIARGEVLAQQKVSVDLSPLVAKSTVTSHTDPAKEISVILVLPLSDLKGATDYAQRVNTPKDEFFGKYLTPSEFAASYGGSEADYNSLESWAKTNGLKVSQRSVSRTTLTVRGTVAKFEALFNTQINNYRSPDGKAFYSASSKPTIPSGIPTTVIGIIGLSSTTQFAPLAKVFKMLGETPAEKPVTNTAGGTGPGGAYSAADLRTAYNIPSHLGAGTPQTVAVFEQGGFDPNDVQQYLATNKLPSVSVKARNVNGYGGGINDPGVELEAVLDIDMIIGINPAAKEVLVYEDGDDPFGVALIDALTDVAGDNLAQTLSISYGTDEAIQGNAQIAAEGQVLVQLAAQGQTVLVSAGDNGAYGRSGFGLNASDPGAQPFVTSVGGTTLFTGPNESYIEEEVWNLLLGGLGATGGGVSAFWPIPSWQFETDLSGNKVSVAVTNGGSSTNRNFPDIAAVGNPATGVAVYSALNGGWIQIGGTSVSAPIWAGYVSILDAARRTTGLGKIGFFNPTLYNLAETHFGVAHDISSGSNGNVTFFGIPGYNAGLFYDNCSGWGSIWGESCASILLSTPTKTGTRPAGFGGISGTAQITTAKVSWAPSNGATGYLIQVSPTNNSTVDNYVSKSTSVALTGLAPKTSYVVAVVALNPSGARQAANVIFLTTN